MTSTQQPPTTYGAALDALRSAQKPSAGTSAYGRWVNRPAGRVVAAGCHVVGMSPNQATAVSATMSALAIILVATVEPGAATAVAAPLLLAGGYVMDSVDGQLSRLRGRGSRSGEWLDHTVDCFKTCLLHLAVLVSFYRWPVGDELLLLVPMVFLVAAVVTFFGLILVPTLRPTRNQGSTLRADGASENPLRPFLLLPLDYGVLCWSFLLLAWPFAFATVYAFLAVSSVGGMILAIAKWWRELEALDAAA